MRYLCFGMGAIGTYIGGSLAAAGHDLIFVVRQGDATKQEIRLDFRYKTLRSEVQVANSISTAMQYGPFDAAFLAVKSFDTPSVLNDIDPFRSDFPAIVCLQNGVENESQIANVVGWERVIGASVTSAVRRLDQGKAVVEKDRGIGIQSTHPLSHDLITLLMRAGVKAHGYQDLASMKWSKLLTNLQANALPAILNWAPAKVLSNPVTYGIECAAMREATQVMKKMNLVMVNLPGAPVKPWVKLMTQWPESVSRPLLARLLGAGRGGKMPSLHIDLYAGKKQSEVVFLNGAVVRFAEKYGLEAPVNQELTEVLTGMASGELPFERYNDHPERILEEIKARI